MCHDANGVRIRYHSHLYTKLGLTTGRLLLRVCGFVTLRLTDNNMCFRHLLKVHLFCFIEAIREQFKRRLKGWLLECA